MAAAFAIQTTPLPLEVTDQLVPLQDSTRPNVDGEGHKLDQVGLGNSVRVRDRQRLAFFQKTLSQIFHGAVNH